MRAALASGVWHDLGALMGDVSPTFYKSASDRAPPRGSGTQNWCPSSPAGGAQSCPDKAHPHGDGGASPGFQSTEACRPSPGGGACLR
eukprot:15090201-Alexandrium_andersonii.AAC.1